MRMFIIVFAIGVADRLLPGFMPENPSTPLSIFLGVCLGLSFLADCKDAYSKRN